jgi:hypothetical protein
MPPPKSVEHLRFHDIGHVRLKSIRVNDVVLLSLADSLVSQIEGVLPTPDGGTQEEVLEAEFFPELTTQPTFVSLTGLQPTAWSDPKPLPAMWRSDAKQ